MFLLDKNNYIEVWKIFFPDASHICVSIVPESDFSALRYSACRARKKMRIQRDLLFWNRANVILCFDSFIYFVCLWM